MAQQSDTAGSGLTPAQGEQEGRVLPQYFGGKQPLTDLDMGDLDPGDVDEVMEEPGTR